MDEAAGRSGVRLEAERPEAVVDDRQRDQERARPHQPVGRADPRWRTAVTQLPVHPEREHDLDDGQRERQGGEPRLHVDGAAEAECEERLAGRIVLAGVHAEDERDGGAGQRGPQERHRPLVRGPGRGRFHRLIQRSSLGRCKHRPPGGGARGPGASGAAASHIRDDPAPEAPGRADAGRAGGPMPALARRRGGRPRRASGAAASHIRDDPAPEAPRAGPGGRAARAGADRQAREGAGGRRKPTAAPPPFALVAHTSPPWRSTIWRTMARPRPEPGAVRAVVAR